MNRIKINTLILGSLVVLFSPVINADTNRALEAWKDFAASSGNPDHQKWVDEISKPEAIALAKEWKDLRGYDVYDLMDKVDLPADLKPGLKITAANMGQYPWLKDYLPATLLAKLTADWGHVDEITIVPSNTYYLHKGYLKGTTALRDQEIELQINEVGELLYPDGRYAMMEAPAATAIPFLNPKDGMELNWSFVASATNTDSLHFDPIEMVSCTPASSIDVDYKADLFWMHFHDRQMVEPFGDVADKDEFIEGGALFMLEPNDIRGLAGVRQRYAKAGIEDDFKVFIPSLRRTRVLTGSDAQDPIAGGLDLTWEDWRSYWGKTDPSKFEYTMTGEGWILALPETGYVYDSFEMTEDRCNYKSLEVELRPVWTLEIKDKTGKYMYSKRTTEIDKEFYYSQYHITLDPRGNLFRHWADIRDWRPSTGDAQWRLVVLENINAKRSGFLLLDSQWNDLANDVTEEQFDVDQLRDFK